MAESNILKRGALFTNPFIQLIARWFLGVLFVLSSISKFPHHEQFVEIVKSYKLLPDSIALAYGYALPWIELIVGIYFLLAIFLKPTAIVTIIMGLSFMVANIFAILHGDEFCGSCFGEMVVLMPLQALMLDIFIIIIAFFIFYTAHQKEQLFTLESLIWKEKNPS